MNNYEKMKIYIESRGGKLLSSEISNYKSNFKWICDNGHEHNSNMQMLERKSWCRGCKQENTKIKVYKALKPGFKILTYSSKKIFLICNHGHQITMTPTHILDGNGCGICFRNNKKNFSQRLKLDDVKNKLALLEFNFLDKEYYTLKESYNLSCKNGHFFKRNIKNILNGVVGCPECNNYFKSEIKFRKRLEKIFSTNFPKTRPEWLINPETKCRLELDCYNADLKLAFEYDGHFHFEVRKGLNNDLEKTKKLDKLKEKLCKENGVTLIRIPYFLNEEEFYNKMILGLKVIYGENYWMSIRESEGGTTMPADIKAARQAARNRIVR